MHDQADGLVDHQQVGVLVEDVERDRFGCHRHLLRGRRTQGHGFAPGDQVTRWHLDAVEQGIAGFDPAGQARARKLAEQLRQHGVEAAPGGGEGNLGGARGAVHAGLGLAADGVRPIRL